MFKAKDIKNVAVIAHVDHGKTTLVDAMLKQTNTFRANQEEMGQERLLDTNDLEREKGITILSKNTSIFYKDVRINIIDTPGHADFGGEVERVMNMADGALLIVDAAEGPMPQTKFVLKKAFEAGLKIIVVINKIDRKDADVPRVINEIDDLFLNLATNEASLDFPIIYAVGREGKSFKTMPGDGEKMGNISPLLGAILKNVPSSIKDKEKPFAMMVSSFERNEYLGKLAVGRVGSGKVKKGSWVKLIEPAGDTTGKFKVEKIYVDDGLEKVEVEEAGSGEIIYLAGADNLSIGQTMADNQVKKPLMTINVSEPTIKAGFGANSGMFASQESKFLTSRQLIEKLRQEAETDLGLKLEENENDPSKITVVGRGELHLAILIERLRRQGYAMEVGKPEVVLKKIDGIVCEPWEEMTVLVSKDFVGTVSAEVGKRQGQMIKMSEDKQGGTKMIYKISEQNALGLRSSLMNQTKGQVLLSFVFLGFEPKQEKQKSDRNGVMIAFTSGKALPFGLNLAQKRGTTFVEPREEIYEGQIVGMRPVSGDLEINPCKGKQLTNMRAAGSDEAIILSPAVKYSLEESLDFIESDELIDVTPKAIRLRKRLLSKLDRARSKRKKR